MQAYRSLETKFTHLALLEDALGILHWDTETMMPKGAAGDRADEMAALRGMAHELLVGGDTADLLVAAEQQTSDLDEWQQANLREMRRRLTRASALSRELVEANAKAVSRATIAWREARAKNDFALLAPALAEVVAFQRDIGQARGGTLGLAPYDALLDYFDPGLRQDAVDAIFAPLATRLPELLERVCARQARLPDALPLAGPFSTADQTRLGATVLRAIGFDFERGRLDVSLHPFCGGATNDVRVTARYDEGDWLTSLMALLHEGGHALYQQGRPAQYLRQPVGQARGLTLHESQSLLMEMHVGLTREFIGYLAPLAREAFAGSGPAWSADNIHRIMTKVEPTFIRIDADEITYDLHVIVRYRLEKAMIAGDLPVADLPAAYNDAVRTALGLTVPDDRVGCLQDIHWAGGLWGYFPTYVLGAIAAAQLFDAARRSDAGMVPALARGDFAPLRDWLRLNIHGKGSRYTTAEVLTAATGRPLEAGVYCESIAARYLDGG
jgi:carboxypeptidase Taq